MEISFTIIASIIAIINLWMSLKSLIYNKILFKRYYSQKYDDNYNPKIAVFVPCKGSERNLKEHLEAIANQDYRNFKVIYIVDDIKDPAVEIINKIIEKYPNTELFVAGKAKKCGQKNHNLLCGINYDDNQSDVYVFADSDVQPDANWLKQLIRPLSLETIPVATSFRWLTPIDYSLSGALHSMMSAYLCILMSHQTFRGVWGGSTAIKKKFFNKINVKKVWKNSVVDDMTLTKLLFNKKINRVFVPTCLTVSSNTLSKLSEDIQWYSRQAAFLKTYLKPLWIACIILHAITTFILIMTPVFILHAIYTHHYYYAIVSVIFSFLNMLSYGIMKFIYRDKQRFIHWFFIAPLLQLLGFYSLIKPGFSNNIKWRNISYELHNDGRVKSIRELSEAYVEKV